jgi:wyosine [tRNA(Phe)-imidazoG37] synthetase (radical SAM superfamily)
MVYALADGSVLDHPTLLMAATRGGPPRAVDPGELVPLPRGSDLYLLPGRTALGIDPESDAAVAFEGDGEVSAAAAFLAPAWTLQLHPAYEKQADAPTLPLYAYSAIGFADGKFWTSAIRVDADNRQDPWRFDETRLTGQVHERVSRLPGNLVAQQLERCALEYKCRAAQNYFIGRHEAPIPTSITCNARCIGCISLQSDGNFPASHERVRRAPLPAEVAAVALDHLSRVPDGVVSFGQGCEGEPLLGEELLPASVALIRAGSAEATININTNGSRPDVVEAMCEAGLDSIRVSLNSPRPEIYDPYYRPANYDFDDVRESLAVVKRFNRYRSINYLVFPGVTDTEAELESMIDFVGDCDLDLIQMRNLNIDPELYPSILPEGSVSEGMGMKEFMSRLNARFPHLRYGYFNPKKTEYERMRRSR